MVLGYVFYEEFFKRGFVDAPASLKPFQLTLYAWEMWESHLKAVRHGAEHLAVGKKNLFAQTF